MPAGEAQKQRIRDDASCHETSTISVSAEDWFFSLLVLGVWISLLLDLALGRLVLGVLLAFGLGLAVIVGTMVLWGSWAMAYSLRAIV